MADSKQPSLMSAPPGAWKGAVGARALEWLPLRWFRPLMPPKMAFYGHLISDRPLPQASRYRYPRFEELSDFFEAMLRLGYRFLTYGEFLDSGIERGILLTFDDGFKEIMTELHPFLMERGIPYMAFVLGAPIEDPAFALDIFPSTGTREAPRFLDRQDLESMARDGVSIGFHTRSHYRVVGNEPPGDPALRAELRPGPGLRALLTEPHAFAYPFLAPQRFESFDALASQEGFEVFFDTKGLVPRRGNHFFRVPMDVPPGARCGNPILFNLKNCLKARLADKIRSRRKE